jgi:DNA-binding transcriptional MocR family regulator
MNSEARGSEVLYRQLASRIEGLIEGGTLGIGARVPSVRKLSEQHGISISTALQAYRVLESEGLIEARPQSGYYVRKKRSVKPQRTLALPPEPQMSLPPSTPITVHNSDMVLRVMQATSRTDLLQLGAAVCCTSHLPTQALHRSLVTAIKKYPEAGNSYDISPGTLLLRAPIARRSLDYGCALSPDDIVLTVGATEALNLCLRAVTKPGDAVAIESPTYFNVLQIIECLGLRAVEVATHPRDGIVLESLEEALERENIAACIFMPSFSNPLGASMSNESKKKMVEMLESRDIPLIEDDVWSDTCFESPRPHPAKSFDKSGNVMLVSGFSKTLAPGYRVGWVALGKWKKKVEYLKLVSSEGNPTLTSLAVAEFLEHGGYDYHLRRVRRYFAEQTQMALEGVARHFPEGTRANRPRGGHFLWIELPGQIQALDIFEDALRAGVSIAPGPIFSARQKFSSFVRLNCGYHWAEKTEMGFEILGQLVKARL